MRSSLPALIFAGVFLLGTWVLTCLALSGILAP